MTKMKNMFENRNNIKMIFMPVLQPPLQVDTGCLLGEFGQTFVGYADGPHKIPQIKVWLK